MTTYIPAALRQLVDQRAAGACEYCLIHQIFSIYSYEVDHVTAFKSPPTTLNEKLGFFQINIYKRNFIYSIIKE
jgi:5-methylcytosine-specific restriction endonuclease McrA